MAATKAPKPPAALPVSTGYWLLKSEPDVFSWEMQKARGAAGEPWTGVRNYLARNNMRAMRLGDLGFFYHSNLGKEIVGVVRVIRLAYPEPGDDTGTWACVDVEAVCDMPEPVSLAAIKANRKLLSMSLVTSMRLSVQPVMADEWNEVCRMGGLAGYRARMPRRPKDRTDTSQSSGIGDAGKASKASKASKAGSSGGPDDDAGRAATSPVGPRAGTKARSTR